MNELIFLGTAGDSVVRAKQLRSSAGIVLKLNGFQFLLDPGEGTLVKMREYGLDIMKTSIILVSHHHLGHSNDLNAVIDAITLGGIDTNGYLISTNQVINGFLIGDEENKVLLTNYKRSLIKYMVVEPGQKVGVEDVEIKATRTKHSVEGVGFVFKTPKLNIGYSSDTEFNESIAKQYSDCDVLILNVVNPGPIRKKGNLNTKDAIDFIKVARPRLTIITHFGVEMIKQNPITEARKIEQETKTEVMAAKDGLRIRLDDYSRKVYQEKLDNF